MLLLLGHLVIESVGHVGEEPDEEEAAEHEGDADGPRLDACLV